MGKAYKLTPLQVKNLKEPGLYLDGLGLMLKVTEHGSKSWIHRYMRHGAAHWMGLGPYPEVSLAEAREHHAENRKKLRAGIDPLAERQGIAATAKADRAKAVTFNWCAEKYIKAHEPEWTNPKHAEQWRSTLKTYAAPIIGTLDVAKVETSHVVKIVEPIWHEKAETASRLLGRIASVLDWATVYKHREGENPARWKGHIDMILPARNKAQTVKHHAALPYAQINSLMPQLRAQVGIAARALEFVILTAARSGEVRGATWAEIDEEAGVWVIPAERMKAKREHRVPLSEDAKRLIKSMRDIKSGDLIFPGMKKDKPLSDMSLSAVLKRMEKTDITVHGFRSTFKDWAAEVSHYPNEMSEMALAHTIGDAVEAAYRRGDMVEKRREMMQTWANYCTRPEEKKVEAVSDALEEA
jgi:integrase